MKARRAWLVAVVLLAPVPAQAAEPLVSGRILDATGRPVAGLPVTLVPKRDAAEDVIGGFVAVFTLGISCLAGAPPCDRVPTSSTTTSRDGRYAFDGAAVAKVGAEAVLLAGARGGPMVRVQLTVDRPIDLGDLPLWEPRVTLANAATTTTLSWTAPPGADGRTVVRMAFARQAGSRVVAGATGVRGSGSYDRRTLEDRYVEVVLDAGFTRPRAGKDIRVDWTSSPVAAPGAGPPPSRGRACTADGVAQAPCTLTDGERTEGSCRPTGSPAPCPPSPVKEVVVDLGTARSLDVVTAAGTFSGVVEGSSDRRSWRTLDPVSPAPGWDVFVAAAAGGPVRWVRVKSTAADAPTGATEIAAWPPGAVPAVVQPRPTDPAPAALPTSPPAAQGTTPVADDPVLQPRTVVPARGRTAEWVAFAALVLVTLATCVVAVRTTRRPATRPSTGRPVGPPPPAAGWPVPYEHPVA